MDQQTPAGNDSKFEELFKEASAVLRTDPIKAESLLTEAVRIAEHQGKTTNLIRAKNNLAACKLNKGDFSEAVKLLEEVLPIAQSTGDFDNTARAKGNLGAVYYKQGYTNKAFEYFTETLELRREMNDVEGQRFALASLGSVLLRMGQYSRALEHMYQALEICEALGEEARKAIILNDCAIVYIELKNFEKAVEFLRESLALRRKTSDTLGEAITLSNLGLAVFNMGNHEEALEMYQNSLSLRQNLGDLAGEGQCYLRIGTYYRNRGNYVEADTYYDAAEDISIQQDMPYLRYGVLHSKAQLAFERGEFMQALSFCTESLAIAVAGQDHAFQLELHDLLTKIHEQIGDVSSALYHLKLYHELREQVYSSDTVSKVAQVEAYYAERRADKKINEYQTQNEQLNSANNKLQNLNSNLRAITNEKNRLLNVLSNEMQSTTRAIYIESGVSMAHGTRLTADELHARMARVEKLSRELLSVISVVNELEQYDVPSIAPDYAFMDLTDLVNEHCEIGVLRAVEANVQFVVEPLTEDFPIYTDKYRCRRCVELFFNYALRFACPNSVLKFSVERTSTSAPVVYLVFTDYGTPLPIGAADVLFDEPLNIAERPATSEISLSIGFALIRRIAKFLNGSFTFAVEPDCCTFTLQLPITRSLPDETE